MSNVVLFLCFSRREDIELILVIIVTVKSQVLLLLLASATFCELKQCKFLLTKNEIKPKVLGKELL